MSSSDREGRGFGGLEMASLDVVERRDVSLLVTNWCCTGRLLNRCAQFCKDLKRLAKFTRQR